MAAKKAVKSVKKSLSAFIFLALMRALLLTLRSLVGIFVIWSEFAVFSLVIAMVITLACVFFTVFGTAVLLFVNLIFHA